MAGSQSILVVDVGTSGVRAAVVRPDGSVTHTVHRPVPPTTPAAGLVEVDGRAIAEAALDTAKSALESGGPVGGVGIANQRATALVWERHSGLPVAPGIGWQDLRTVGACLELQAEGVHLAPNASATKVAAILDQVDSERRRAGELCWGTVDSWVAWVLSGGYPGEGRRAEPSALHLTDPSNAGVTGLLRPDASGWDERVAATVGVPAAMFPDLVDTSGAVGEASALPGAPPICALAGDQQASLVGQGATRAGLAKATFGTGGMLDLCTGERPAAAEATSPRSDGGPDGGDWRGAAGTFPIVAWRRSGRTVWGVEAAMLSAGACIEWLVEDLGLLENPAASDEVAERCAETGDVWFVPALFGLGTPVWDFGARGTLVGITRGTGRPELVRAVLAGIAHRGADLLLAAEADGGLEVPTLRVDGGMSANDVFVSELARATGRVVELSPELEATTRGAGYLAGLAIGTWRDEDELAQAWRPRRRVEPDLAQGEVAARRARWLEARARAERTVPELSAISF